MKRSRGSRKQQSLLELAFAGDLFFWHLAIVHTTVANATFFATTAPIWVVAFGWLLFGVRVTKAVLGGLCLCLIGGGALLAQSFQLRSTGALGDVFGIATGVFFGLYFLAVQAARADTSAARLTFEATAVSAAILLVVALCGTVDFAPYGSRSCGYCSHGLDQSFRGPGSFIGRLGSTACGFFVIGDFS